MDKLNFNRVNKIKNLTLKLQISTITKPIYPKL